ncbi:MAG: hypothetical protein ACRDWE_14345 [Acidimicrobiales bacterium]
MRKYFTRRCVGLHLAVAVLVPAFLVAGWWQYHVALGGNDLSWVYTVEWPFFAVYALYVWWKMIHDRTTMLDRLWAVKARAAADAEGKPLHQIPGWAMDKDLSREVVRASLEAARLHELGGAAQIALESGSEAAIVSDGRRRALELPPEIAQRSGSSLPAEAPRAEVDPADAGATVVDARVIDDKIVVDEELDAYNRYLAELSWNGPPKRWRSPRTGARRTPEPPGKADAVGGHDTAIQVTRAAPAELGHGEARKEA